MTVGIWTCCSGSCFLKASEDSKAFQVASQASEPASQPGLGRTYVQAENLPNLLDFVQNRGCWNTVPVN